MKYAVGMASCGMTYVRDFMKTGIGVQAILRFCLGNLKGCNVGITDGIPLVTSQSDSLRECETRQLCTTIN
jgi:hypothetical protein